MKKKIIALLFITLNLITNAQQYPQIPSEFIGCSEYESFLNYSRIFSDTLLNTAVDRYGTKDTPLFGQMLSLKTHKPPTQEDNPYWQKHYGTDYATSSKGSNLARETYMLQALNKLSKITEDQKYKKAVTDYMKFYFKNCVSSTTGLWAWGEHMSYDMYREKLFHYREEMELSPAPWDLFWEIDSSKVISEIEGFYKYHTYDKEGSFIYDRHGNYYSGKLDDIAVLGAYIKHSGIYLYGFTFLWSKTHDQKYLKWMKKEADLYWNSRNQYSGLIADEVQHGGVSRQTPMLIYYLLLSYQLDREQKYILEYAEAYLKSFLEAIYDPESGEFFNGAYYSTGTPASSGKMSFWSRLNDGAYLGKTVTQLYKETGNLLYLDYAKKLAAMQEKKKYHNNTGPGAFAQALHFLLDLYELTGDASYLVKSREYASDAITNLFDNGLFKDKIDSYIYNAGYPNDGDHTGHLALMLLRLYEVEQNIPIHWSAPSTWSRSDKPILVTAYVDHSIEKAKLIYQKEYSINKIEIEPAKIGENNIEFEIPEVGDYQGNMFFEIEIKDEEGNWISSVETVGKGVIAINRCENGAEFSEWNYPRISSSDEKIPIRFKVTSDCKLKQVKLYYKYPGDTQKEILVTAPIKSGDQISVNIPSSQLCNTGKLKFWVTAWSNPEFPTLNRSEVKTILTSSESVFSVKPLRNEEQQFTIEKTGVGISVISSIEYTLTFENIPEDPTSSIEGLPTPGLSYFKISSEPIKSEKLEKKIKLEIPIDNKWKNKFVENTLALYHWDGQRWNKKNSIVSNNIITAEISQLGMFTVAAIPRMVWRKVVDQPILSSPALGQLDKDKALEIIFASRDFGLYTYAYDANGTRQWAVSADGGFSFPVLYDITNNGLSEIVVGNTDGKIYVLNPDGTVLWSYDAGSPVKTPAIGDLDGDGEVEIVIGTQSGSVIAVSKRGKLKWKYITDAPKTIPVLADIDGDNKLETVIAGRDNKLWVLDSNGKYLWDIELIGRHDYGPAVGDLNGDGKKEIVINSRTPEHKGKVYAISYKGKILWEVPCDGEGDWAASLGDMNNDGQLEVIANDVGSALNVIDYSGKIVQKITLDSWNTLTPVMVDFTGDGKLDYIVAGNEDRNVHVYDNSGKKLWSFEPTSPTLGGAKVKGGANPAIADVDGDGYLNVLFGDDEGWFYNLRTETKCKPFEIKVNHYHNDPAHTGVSK